MKVSPIAEYLRINKAIPKHDENGCHFFSPEGLYLGRLTKTIINNYRVISLETFGEGLKKMYTKSVSIGQQFAYIKNPSSPIGISIVPIKTYMRKIFVNFIDRTSDIQDTEQSLTNKLDLVAVDESSNTGLYDTERPLKYSTLLTKKDFKPLKNNKFTHYVN